ncbi:MULTISPECIES: (2Fe-2S)-binding protein [Marinobacter]|jgi:hypothetical protein|uniref:(2Fe-2S)-binding protein n=1 Tax=Marinobacter TaxID=2742 RepID=UPI001FFF7864|nr:MULTISPECIES: (2Fe-2S)-binding protein [Marinobacter]MCK2149346.1 (2Fe-2S)-binding protein [Marinobacter alexandrii]
MAVPECDYTDWRERYRQLLSDSDLNADTVLSQALALTGSSRQAQSLSASGRTVPLSLAQCLTQPERLRHQLRLDHPETSDARLMRAHVSVVQQDLALSVIAPLTLRLFRDGEAPLPNEDEVFLGQSTRTMANSRWFHTPTGPSLGVEDFVEHLAGQVNAWYPVFRKALGVSPGAFWSSIGLGLGAPFSAVWNQAEAQSVCALAQAWLDNFECDSSRFVGWIPATLNGQTRAIPQRKGCCLKYLLPEGGYCGTCGVHRKARLAELNRLDLDPSPRPRPSQSPGQWLPGQ